MSRIADVLQKAWEQGHSPDSDQPVIEPADGPSTGSSSDGNPWQLEETVNAGEIGHRQPLRWIGPDASNPATLAGASSARNTLASPAITNAIPNEQEGTVAQILTPSFSISWNEAVAIVQEIAAKIRRGVSVPAPEHLVIDQKGRVSFGSRNDSNEHPVVSLAVLLGWLIERSDAPRTLRRLVAENACATPRFETPKPFSQALSEFEDAKRSTYLRAVADRLHARASSPAYPVVQTLTKARILSPLARKKK